MTIKWDHLLGAPTAFFGPTSVFAEHKRRQDEAQDGGLSASGGAKKTMLIVLLVATLLPLVMMLMWMISLIMTAVSASRYNAAVSAHTLPSNVGSLPQIATASSMLWYVPFINLIMSSIFTHKTKGLSGK